MVDAPGKEALDRLHVPGDAKRVLLGCIGDYLARQKKRIQGPPEPESISPNAEGTPVADPFGEESDRAA